ncbi:hypothetical protein [Glycomyces salinus]|uniref:hypothetical protein n=1 Tax=Glycomyces salinus TaxID=980294 RepID=UPI0018ED9BF8|nr:hypothetical protein [Glycomyces salinus]
MRPTAAEVARTLARGRLSGTLEFASGPPVTAFHHATDRFGRLLVLSRDAEDPQTALGHRAGAPTPTAKAVRLDRYGLLVDLGTSDRGPKRGRWARLEFARGVRNQHELAHVLHPILFRHRCTCHDHGDD